MKKALLPILFVICIITSSGITAQNFNLVKDINTSKDANPANIINNLYIGFSASSFFVNTAPVYKYAVLNGISYFSADDGIHGTEIWRSDKTAAGTYMLKDINAGSGGSNIESITVAGNKLYFVANTIVYESDGTEAGTFPVPGITYTGDQTTCLTPVGNMLYFFTNVSRLWKTDGTAAGTSMVIDFRQTFNYSKDFLGQLTNVNGTVYFVTGSDNDIGPELWKSDGTQAGTVLVKDIYPGAMGSRPGNLTAIGNKLYFSANDGTGIHLFTTNGTAAGTHTISNPANAVLPQDITENVIDVTPFTVAQQVIYFKATTPGKGEELYKYNTVNQGAAVTLVKDIATGVKSSSPSNITAVGNTVFFSVVNTGNQPQLWKTDGTSAGTVMLKSVTPGYGYAFSDFAAANGKLLFACSTQQHGSEIWTSDGTVAGTNMIKDIYPGSLGGAPQNITYVENGKSLFSANNGSTGIELWKTDGTTSGTLLVKNINNTTTAGSNPQLSGAGYYKSHFYFSAYSPENGNALYKTDGTMTGTQLLKNLIAVNSSNAGYFTQFKNALYFAASDGNYTSIYRTDGTNAGTIQLFNTGDASDYVEGIFAGTNNLYVFYYNTQDSLSQLWTTDGTAANSYKIQNVQTQPPAYAGSVYSAGAVGNVLYFSAYDSLHGQELWKATPTAGSAKMVTDLNPGTNSASPSGLLAFNGKIYFRAQDSLNSMQAIFMSDGTKNGTKKLHDGYEPIVKANGRIFFSGYNSSTGQELYKSDGTITGTKLVKDINVTGDSYPHYLTVAGNTVYFTAYDNDHGYELWKTDGTQNGTVLVKDLLDGVSGSNPYNLTAVTNRLYFQASDGAIYNALYVTNGQAGGTYEITDTGLNGVAINNMAAGGDKVFLNGYSYARGSELYAGAYVPTVAKTEIKAVELHADLTANITGNPVRDILQLQVNTVRTQQITISITDINGKPLASATQTINEGSHSFSFPVNTYAAGIYVVHITGKNSGDIQMKFVK